MHAIKIKLLTLLITASVILSMIVGSTLAAFSDYETIQMSISAGYMGLTKTCELDCDIIGKAFNVLNDGSLNGQLELVGIYENGANLFSEENQPNGLFDSSPTFNISVFYNNELKNYKIGLNETLPLTILPDMAVNSAAKILISDNRIIPLEAKAEEIQPALDVVQPSETIEATTAAPDTQQQDIQPTIGHTDAAWEPAQPTGAATEDTSGSETEQAQTETETAAPTEDTIEQVTEEDTTAYETKPELSETETASTEEVSAELESEQSQETEQTEQQSEWEETSQTETLPTEPPTENSTEAPATEPSTQTETQYETQVQQTSADIEETQETNAEDTSKSLTPAEDTTMIPAQALAMESKAKPDKDKPDKPDKPEKPTKPKPTQHQPELLLITKTYTFVFRLTRSTFVSTNVSADFQVIERRWCFYSTTTAQTQPQQQVDRDVEENTENSHPISETASEPVTHPDESEQAS